MQSGKIIGLGVSALLLFSFCLITSVSADNSNDILVNNTFSIEFKTGTNLEITANIDVETITIYGTTTYDSSGIQSIATSSNPDDIEDLGEIKGELREDLLNQLGFIFENSDITPVGKKPTYGGSGFHDSFYVNLTSAFFGLDETVNIHDFVNGVLDIGGKITYNMKLYSEVGWNNTYNFNLPSSILLSSADTSIVSSNQKQITWKVLNWDGETPTRDATLKIHYKTPTMNAKEEDITLEFKLDSSNAVDTSLTTDIIFKSINTQPYSIPSFISDLNFMPSDGIRLFTANELFSWDDFYTGTFKPIEEKIVSTIESSSFNQTLNAVFAWDESTSTNCTTPYNISQMNDDPAVIGKLRDSDVNLLIDGNTARGYYGLSNAGGEINVTLGDLNFGDQLDQIGYNYTGYYYLPEGITLGGLNAYTWDIIDTNITGILESDINPPIKENISTLIEIDITSTDLNILSFFTGNMEFTFGMTLEENRNYYITEIPEQFTLPEKIHLTLLNSDAFRLCIEEGIFHKENVDEFLKNEKDLFKHRMENILPKLKIKSTTARNIFDESLNWDEDITKMDYKKPVKTSSYANTNYPISFHLSFIPPGVNIPIQKYNFSGLENQSVTYRTIFPDGIGLEVSDKYDKVQTGKTKDGREYFEITFTESESNQTSEISVKIVPSALFVIGLLMPCIISFIITIILLVVIYILRKKRKGKRPETTYKKPVMEEEDTEYEDEDYYVPPPPGSK